MLDARRVPAILVVMKSDDPEKPETSALPAPPPAKARAKADRLAREAAALRANLHRRKEQARQQATARDPSRQE